MLTSKGLLGASSSIRRIPQLQSAGMRLASRQFSSLRPSTRPRLTPSRTVLLLVSTRFNSTTTTLPTPTAVEAAEHAGTISSDTLPSYIPTAESLSSISPDQIGYLKSLGLDYGYGPSSCVQYLLENIHLLSATPWWATIVLTVAVIRIVQFPFYMRMSNVAAQMKELNPQSIVFTNKIREAQIRNDRLGMITARQQQSALYRSAGVNRTWLAFPISQAPIFYGFYKNLTGMSELKIPGLVEGGNWWFTNLAACDPYYILPFVSACSLGLQLHLGGEAGTSLQTKKMKQGLMILMPIFSFSLVHSWPAAITLYFFTNSMFGLVQATALRNVWVRDRLGLYPLSTEASKNPLAPSGLEALNIVTKVPAETVVGAPRQIGAKGGFLDRITGGDLKKDGTKKTLVDRILGEKTGEPGGIGKMIKDSRESAKYSEYERKRQLRIEKQEAEERARKKGVMQGKR